MEKTGQSATVAAILAACAPAAPPASVGEKDQGKVEKNSDGWPHFVSPNHPYEIDYPLGWASGSQRVGGKTQDIFKGATVGGFQTNVVVVSEPTSKSLSDYSADVQSEITQLIIKARGGVGGPLGVSGYDTQVAGQKATVIRVSLPKGALLINPDLEQRMAVFVKDRRAWQVVLTSVPSAVAAEEPNFTRMLSSFKFK